MSSRVLAQHHVVPYLLKHGLITEREIVINGLSVVDASRRNQNYKVTTQDGQCYLLKQGIDPTSVVTLANEAAVYKFLHRSGLCRRSSWYVPRYLGYDQDRNILILELIIGARNLREYQAARSRFSLQLARNLGNALAALHASSGPGRMPRIEAGSPWILSIRLPTIDFLDQGSNASIEFLRILQQSSEFGRLADELPVKCLERRLIHGDLKWDNVLVLPKVSPGSKPSVMLIDFEVASFGDPCWDVGSVFSEYLRYWLLSIPMTGRTSPDQLMNFARIPVECVQPAIGAFWRSYAHRMELGSDDAHDCLIQSVRYSAMRLVQTAFEELQWAVGITPNSLCYLQVSLNILQRPEAAAIHLMGLPPQEVIRS